MGELAIAQIEVEDEDRVFDVIGECDAIFLLLGTPRSTFQGVIMVPLPIYICLPVVDLVTKFVRIRVYILEYISNLRVRVRRFFTLMQPSSDMC